MDGVSTIALLASIESLAEGAFKLVSLINTIRQGGKQRLRLHYDPEEQAISEQWLDTIGILNQKGGIFDHISAVFDDLTNRLQPKMGHRKVLQTLRWPLNKSEVDELAAHLERLKSTVSLAYNSTNAAVIREIQSDTKYVKLSMANDQVKAIIDWISNFNFLKQQTEFVSQSRQGTGQWFLHRTVFEQWAASHESMLWCPGIMGAGKTYLASIAVDYIKTVRKDQEVALLVIYCGYNKAKGQSVDSLIAALIKQFLQIRPDISEDLKNLYEKSSGTDVLPRLDKLTKILRAELVQFDACFIVIDGLDEMLEESSRQTLLETLTHGKVNILVTSRPLDSIGELFSSIIDVTCDGCEKEGNRFIYHCKQCLNQSFDLCEGCYGKGMRCPEDGHYLIKTFGTLEVEIEATPTDIRNYVEWRIDHEPKVLNGVNKKKNLREDIASTIVLQANGIYVLWICVAFFLAKLHMDFLATKRTPGAIQIALQNLPTKIGDTYDLAMERIMATNDDDRQIAMNFLLWIAFSFRPLRTVEVEHASSILLGARDVDHDNILGARELTSTCTGLVVVDASDIVRLVHFSAQNYFRDHRHRWFSDGHTIIARQCLTYLLYKEFDTGACSGPREKEDFDRKVNVVETYQHDYTPLMAAVYYERVEIVGMFLHARGLEINMQSGQLTVTALGIAACYGNLQIIRQILTHPDIDVNKLDDSRTPLTNAAVNGLAAVVEALIDCGADTEAREGPKHRGGTPLNRAIDSGHIAVVKLLLSRGANAKVLDAHNRTIIHSAAINGQDETLRFLLQEATDIGINAQGTDGRPALHDAAYFNYCETIGILFQNGARTDIHDGDDKSPLGVAKDMHNLEALELLRKLRKQESYHDSLSTEYDPVKHTKNSIDSTETGFLTVVNLAMKHAVKSYIESSRTDPNVDINLTDTNRYSALHFAVQEHHVDILSMLLSAPNININCLDNNERSPLHWCSIHYDPDAAVVLLNAGADYSLKDNYQYTALSMSLRNRRTSAVAVLIMEAGAMPTERDMPTSLVVAVEWGSGELVERLVREGCGDLEIKGRDGLTLVKRAEEAGIWGVVGVNLRLCEERERERKRRMEERRCSNGSGVVRYLGRGLDKVGGYRGKEKNSMASYEEMSLSDVVSSTHIILSR
ncbi:MAG: hypothetical protein Q9178_002357 [Gyalolechia marmorata]